MRPGVDRMTHVTSEDAPPAGWYPDPKGGGQRYWDGAGWTDSFSPGPVAPQASTVNPQVVVMGTKTNGMAIASLVLGILWLYGVGSILALIFGLIGQKQIDESNGTQSGRGMATAGVVLGVIGIVGVMIIIALVIAGSS